MAYKKIYTKTKIETDRNKNKRHKKKEHKLLTHNDYKNWRSYNPNNLQKNLHRHKKDTNTDTYTDTNTNRDTDTNTETKREKNTDKDIVDKSDRRINKIVNIYISINQ
jgi:hypothetical protein